MKKLKNSDTFYDLPEPERIAMIGQVFEEEWHKPNLYFPIGLAHGEFNYGKQQGLIFVTPIITHQTDGKWFRVGACSPDDLDVDLDFDHRHTHLRQEVIAYIRTMHKLDVTYRGVMGEIQKHFGAGEITS